MRILKPVKNLLTYLPVLAVLAATVIGLFIGKDLYPTSLDSQPKTPAQAPTEPDNPPSPISAEAMGPCGFSPIYTSLPPKCKTLDGEFIVVPGLLPKIFGIPQGK